MSLCLVLIFFSFRFFGFRFRLVFVFSFAFAIASLIVIKVGSRPSYSFSDIIVAQRFSLFFCITFSLFLLIEKIGHLEERYKKPEYVPNWEEECNALQELDQRHKAMKLFSSLAKPHFYKKYEKYISLFSSFSPFSSHLPFLHFFVFFAHSHTNRTPHVSYLPLWHGTDISILESLFTTGYAILTAREVGFFGKGICIFSYKTRGGEGEGGEKDVKKEK